MVLTDTLNDEDEELLAINTLVGLLYKYCAVIVQLIVDDTSKNIS